jgi:hypothetical protein
MIRNYSGSKIGGDVEVTDAIYDIRYREKKRLTWAEEHHYLECYGKGKSNSRAPMPYLLMILGRENDAKVRNFLTFGPDEDLRDFDHSFLKRLKDPNMEDAVSRFLLRCDLDLGSWNAICEILG